MKGLSHFKKRVTLGANGESTGRAPKYTPWPSSASISPVFLSLRQKMEMNGLLRYAFLSDVAPRHSVIWRGTFRDSVVISFSSVECPTSGNIHLTTRRRTREQQRLPTEPLRDPKNRPALLLVSFTPRTGPDTLGIRAKLKSTADLKALVNGQFSAVAWNRNPVVQPVLQSLYYIRRTANDAAYTEGNFIYY
jgi:hypothetical protein